MQPEINWLFDYGLLQIEIVVVWFTYADIYIYTDVHTQLFLYPHIVIGLYETCLIKAHGQLQAQVNSAAVLCDNDGLNNHVCIYIRTCILQATVPIQIQSDKNEFVNIKTKKV